mgnify:CR=1 FL=1
MRVTLASELEVCEYIDAPLVLNASGESTSNRVDISPAWAYQTKEGMRRSLGPCMSTQKLYLVSEGHDATIGTHSYKGCGTSAVQVDSGVGVRRNFEESHSEYLYYSIPLPRYNKPLLLTSKLIAVEYMYFFRESDG